MKKLVPMTLMLSLLCSLITTPSIPVKAATQFTIKNVTQTAATTSSISLTWDAFKKDETDNEDYYYQVWTAPVVAVTSSAITIEGEPKDTQETAGEWTVKDSTYNNTITLSSLEQGTDCYVRVYAYTATIPRYLVTSKAEALKVATKPPKANKPKIVSTTANSISLTWDKITGADKYKIYGTVKGDTNFSLLATTLTNAETITNLPAATEYAFYIVPVNISGTYEAENSSSSILPATGKTLPLAPTNLKLANEWMAKHTIKATWDETTADGYEVEVSDADTAANLKVYDTDDCTLDMEQLTITWQKVRVRGYQVINHEKLYTDWSDYQYMSKQGKVKKVIQKYKTVKKKSKTKSGKKKTKKVKVYKSQAKVTWHKIAGANSYSVYISKKPTTGYTFAAKTKALSFTVKKYKNTALKKGKTYYIKVVSNKNINGNDVSAFDIGNCKSIKLKK